jgi:hypothetical protein
MIRFDTDRQKEIVLQALNSVQVTGTITQIREAADEMGAILDAVQAAEVGPCPACPAPGSD